MSDEDCDDRLSMDEFAELIQHLPAEQVYEIEFRKTKGWRTLFSVDTDNLNPFKCHLCDAVSSCFKNLMAHVNGRKHAQKMENVSELYHPAYTYPKSDKLIAAKNKTTKYKKINTPDVSRAKPEVTSTATPSVEAKKPKETNNPSNASCSQQGNVTEHSKAKPEALPNQKTAATKAAPAKVAAATTAAQTAAKSKVLNTAQQTNKPSTSKDTKFNNGSALSQPTAKVNQKSQPQAPSKPVQSSTTKSEGTNNKAIAARSNSLDKTASASNTNKTSTKDMEQRRNPNIVVNPAAIAKTIIVSEAEEDKPNYVTDKIIIPTSSKTKATSANENTNSTSPEERPMFVTKAYSSKPSNDEVYGILGVEYVIKLTSKNVRYECGLCELVLNGCAMQKHLEGYNHRLRYCEKHFPTAVRHYRQYMHAVPEHELYKVMTPVLAKLAIAIEKHHGRNLPYECKENEYICYRQDVLAKVYSLRHACEQYGPSFTHVIDAKEIDKYIQERHLYTPPVSSRAAMFDGEPLTLAKDKSPVRSNLKNLSESSAVFSDNHKNTVRENNKILMSKNTISSASNVNEPIRNNYTLQPNHTMANSYAINTRNNSDIMTPHNFYNQRTMNPVMQTNRTANNFVPLNNMGSFLPSTSYNYNMQSASIPNYGAPPLPTTSLATPTQPDQSQSIDDRTYNKMVDEFLKGTMKSGNANRKRSPPAPISEVMPEAKKKPHARNWQTVTDTTISIENEIANLEAKFRTYRQDPETYPTYDEEWQKFWKRRKDELIAKGLDHRKHNFQPEWVQFIKQHIEEVYKTELNKLRGNSVPNVPTHSNNRKVPDHEVSPEPEKRESESTQVVAVLRLMAAMEDNLGSLGPKIITLLSKALQMEKTSRGKLITHLMNTENCSIIETAKEKFKGLLIAGIVEGSKQRAMSKAIDEAEALLDIVQQHQKQHYHQQRQEKELGHDSSVRMPNTNTIEDLLKLIRSKSSNH